MEIPPEILQVAQWFAWTFIGVFTLILVAGFLGNWVGGYFEGS
jgi:hypothetical protein